MVNQEFRASHLRVCGVCGDMCVVEDNVAGGDVMGGGERECR
jgi:hypothetical protein